MKAGGYSSLILERGFNQMFLTTSVRKKMKKIVVEKDCFAAEYNCCMLVYFQTARTVWEEIGGLISGSRLLE